MEKKRSTPPKKRHWLYVVEDITGNMFAAQEFLNRFYSEREWELVTLTSNGQFSFATLRRPLTEKEKKDHA